MKTPLFFLAALTLSAALIFGGGARQGLIVGVVPELLSLPLILMAAPRAWPSLRADTLVVAILSGLILLPALQLVPLPSFIWTNLPGRTEIVDILAVAGAPLGWRAISMAPGATARALLSLAPPVAIFLACVALDRASRGLLSLIAIACGVVSAVLAMLQALGGGDSGLYLYSVTNIGRGVGFFANDNHFAALQYCLLPLAAATLVDLPFRKLAAPLAILGGVAPTLFFGLALSGSRSALILGGLSAILTIAWLMTPHFARWGKKRSLAIVVAFFIVALPIMGGLGLLAILERFSTQESIEDARWMLAGETWRQALLYFPFGAGFGVFPSAYPLHERLISLIPEYVNRAHDDYLETLLEGGLGTLILWMAASFFLLRSALRARGGTFDEKKRQARAGVLVMLLLMIHSLWDYPLRTIALASLFALVAGYQTEAPLAAPGGSWRWFRRRKRRRRRSSRSSKRAAPAT